MQFCANFFKGIAISISQIVPGVSGGTIAVSYTHLYEKIYDITDDENIFSLLVETIEKLFSNKLLKLINSKEIDIIITRCV